MAFDLDTNIVTYLTGAATSGGAQTTTYESFGGYRSSTAFVNDSMENIFRRVDFTDAASGVTQYLCLWDENESATSTAYDYKRYFHRTAETTATTQVVGSGAVTVVANSITGFDANNGYIKMISGATNEIMFYSSVNTTNNEFVVGAAGRGVRGSTAVTHAAGTSVQWYPWCDMISEQPNTTGGVQTIVDVETAPALSGNASTTWYTPVYSSTTDGFTNGVGINNSGVTDGEDLAAGEGVAFWYRFIVPPNTGVNASVDIAKTRKVAQTL